MLVTDKITKENVLLRAFSEIKVHGANNTDTGVVRICWTPEGGLAMSFDSSWRQSFRCPVKRFGFYGDKFFVESNRTRYEITSREPDGLWRGPEPGTVALGFLEGKFLDSSLGEIGVPEGTKVSLEVIAKIDSNVDTYAVMTFSEDRSYPLRKMCFEVVPVGLGTQGESIYVLTLYTPRNCYRMVVERGA